jgi:hypothetical protein
MGALTKLSRKEQQARAQAHADRLTTVGAWEKLEAPFAFKDAHDQDVWKSAVLSKWEGVRVISPHEIIRILSEAKVSFVLVGAHGLAGWRKEPRATEDVDLVVAQKHLKKATKVLCAAYPNLAPEDLTVVIRLRDRESGNVEIDLMKPVQQPYREVFHHTYLIRETEHPYRIPSLEMALVMKYSAMTSDNRQDADRYQDAHDFILMVQRNPDFDRDTVTKLGRLLYPAGGEDVLEAVRQVLAGERLKL